MRRLCLSVVTVLVIAGCGSKDPSTPASTPTTTSTTTVTKKPDEPKGKLSRAEYSSMTRAYRIARKVEGNKDLGKAIRLLRRGCRELSRDTALLDTVRSDCVATMRFLIKARELTTRKAECTRAGQAGDVSCFAELFRNIGRSARVESVHAARTNAELRKRAIRGRCAHAIGADTKDIAKTREVVHDALGAAHALEARNQGSFTRAVAELQADLQHVGDGSSAAEALRDLKACT